MKLRLISHGKQSGEFILYNVWFLLSKLSVHDQYRNNFVLVGFYQSPLTLFILQRALRQFNRIGGGVDQGFFFLGPARLSTSHTCPAVSDVSKTRHNKCKALNGKNLTTKGILLLFFVCLFQFSLPFKFHSEIQRQMLVTSQRQSVSVLLHACIFHFQDAGRVGNQKLTLWVPLLRLTIVQMPTLTSDFAVQKPYFQHIHSYFFSTGMEAILWELGCRHIMRFQRASATLVLRNKKTYLHT